MAKVFFATPMYGGLCTGFYVQSMLMSQGALNTAGHTAIASFIQNESLIDRARNALTKGFLMSDCTHMMFIDADIRWNPADIPPMIDADVDVICGIYPKKEIDWAQVEKAVKSGVPTDQLKNHTGSFVVNLVGYTGNVTVPTGQPLEIWNGGTGFMLIKREVFEKMADHVETYVNDVTDLAGNIGKDPIKRYFATSIEPGTQRLLSEDYHFCAKWREIGGKVHAAPWVNLAHVGTYIFEGQLLRQD